MSKEEIEKAKDRMKILLKDECTCPECLRNKNAYKTLLQYIDQLELEVRATEKVHEYDVKMIDEVKGEAVKLYKKIDKQSKIIDEMAEQLSGLTILDIKKDEYIVLGDKEEIKQYFEKKVEEK